VSLHARLATRSEPLCFSGPIVYAKVLGQPILVLNSAKAVTELLNTRGAIYSDRHQRTMMKLTGIGQDVGAAPAGPRHRRMRGLMSQALGTQAAVARFTPMLARQTQRLMLRIMQAKMTLKDTIEK
jgi:cytochrome P450